jgi:hypothetical protein
MIMRYIYDKTGGNGSQFGIERETGIGVAASRHANQTEFESNRQIQEEKGKAGRWNMSGLEEIVR